MKHFFEGENLTVLVQKSKRKRLKDPPTLTIVWVTICIVLGTMFWLPLVLYPVQHK